MPPLEPVLILGAGINGAALARELTLNGVGVVIVDSATWPRSDGRLVAADSWRAAVSGISRVRSGARVAGGADAAAQACAAIRPTVAAVHSARQSVRRLADGGPAILRLKAGPPKPARASRGLWPVRIGLALYDAYARDSTLPRRKLFRADSPEAVPVDPKKFRWMYAFSDAQAIYPERFTLALLEDAATDRGTCRHSVPIADLSSSETRRAARSASRRRRQPERNRVFIRPFGNRQCDGRLGRSHAFGARYSFATTDRRHEREAILSRITRACAIGWPAVAFMSKPPTAGPCSCCRSARRRWSARPIWSTTTIRRKPSPRRRNWNIC